MNLQYLKQVGIRLVAGLALSIVLLLADGMGWLNPVYSGFNFVMKPIEFWTGRVVVSVGQFFDTFGHIASLRDENSKLKVENVELQSEMAKLGEIQKENDSLKNQLALPVSKEWKLETARILSVDTDGSAKHVVIDKGSRAGVREGDAVVVGDLLVGIVKEVFESTSKVRLVSHPEAKLIAIDQQTRAKGLVHGSLEGVVLSDVLNSDALNEGDSVITWSEDIPQGLMVGKIRKIEDRPTSTTKSAYIDTGVALEDLDYIFVILDY
jgi:rod shape-determining protein MreC